MFIYNIAEGWGFFNVSFLSLFLSLSMHEGEKCRQQGTGNNEHFSDSSDGLNSSKL